MEGTKRTETLQKFGHPEGGAETDRLRTLMATGRKLLDKHGLQDWQIEVRDKRTKRALTPDDFLGYRDPSQKQIVVYRDNDLRFRQAVLHQIAHVLIGDDDHTMSWIRKAQDVGLPYYYVTQYYPEAFVHADADETHLFTIQTTVANDRGDGWSSATFSGVDDLNLASDSVDGVWGWGCELWVSDVAWF